MKRLFADDPYIQSLTGPEAFWCTPPEEADLSTDEANPESPWESSNLACPVMLKIQPRVV
jgi:hypothetical protein